MSAAEYAARRARESHVLLDVREPVQFSLCALRGALHVPLRALLNADARGAALARVEAARRAAAEGDGGDGLAPVYVVCRRGIDSRRAVTLLTEQCGLERVFDIAGGLQAWTATVAPDFPRY